MTAVDIKCRTCHSRINVTGTDAAVRYAVAWFRVMHPARKCNVEEIQRATALSDLRDSDPGDYPQPSETGQ